MLYVVAYDISENALRTRVSKLLVSVGTRVQKSVFEVDMEPRHLSQLLQTLRSMLHTGDSMRCYPLCEACTQKADAHNPSPLARNQPYYLI